MKKVVSSSPLTSPGDFISLAAGELQQRQHSALRALLHHAMKHPLTKGRLARISSSMIDQEEIPKLMDLIQAVRSPDHTDAIIEEMDYGAFGRAASGSPIVFSTGGTTGRPTMLLNTYEETLRNAAFHARGYMAAGILPHHRVATFGGSGTYASEYCVYHALSMTGCTIVPINDFRLVEDNIAILLNLRVNVLLTMPSEAYGLLDYLEKANIVLSCIERVVTGGEPLSEQMKDRMRRCLSPSVAFGSTFQTADVGTIGYQCGECGPNEYHLHSDLVYAEIEPIEDTPELVITNLDRMLMPALKIRTGDRAEWVNLIGQECSCGSTAGRIRLLGRTRDLIKIGGEKVSTDPMTRLPDRLGLREHMLRIEISTDDDGRDAITIFSSEVLDTGLQDVVTKVLYSEPKLAQMLQEGRCKPLEFRPFSQAATSGGYKNRVVVDVRR